MADPFFDATIVGDWLCGEPEAAAELARYRRHRLSRVAWTQIVAQEPLETREHVRELIAPFEVVELDGRMAAAAAELHGRTGMGLLEAMVLATAQVSGAILVTRNTKDFPAALPGIRIPYLREGTD